LPDARDCTPAWIMAEAVQLIVDEHNRSLPGAPITGSDLGRIRALARRLSFAGPAKETQFDEEVPLEPGGARFRDSPARLSRFFNGVPGTLPRYEFTHLRLQEYLAAEGAVHAGLADDASWYERRVLSTSWREEGRFIGAQLAHRPDHPSWKRLRELLGRDDEAGEIARRVAAILATAGVLDGGLELVGRDLRAELWERVRTDMMFIDEALAALAELDVEFLIQCFHTIPPGNLVESTLLFETVYRLIPFGLRRGRLDPDLRQSPQRWLIGLPARAYPNIAALAMLEDVAVDAGRPLGDRIAAVRDLGSARALRSVDALVPLIDEADNALRTATIETLGRIGGPKAAMCLVRVLVERGPREVDLAPTVLNALSVEGYGILETRSVQLLVQALESTESHAVIDLVLVALERMPIPRPPPRLLEIIEGRHGSSAELRLQALGLLAGVRDEAFLSRSLDLLLTESDPHLRRRLLRECPFIPVDHAGMDALWRLVEAPGGDERAGAIELWLRTLRHFPNHPKKPEVARFIRQRVDELVAGQGSDEHRSVLRHLAYVRVPAPVQDRLVRVILDHGAQPSIRKDAAHALESGALSEPQMDALLALFGAAGTPCELLEVIAGALFLQRPGRAPGLLRRVATLPEDAATAVRRQVLMTAHLHGYVIVGEVVFDPTGLPAP
jgi:hypothetical protein